MVSQSRISEKVPTTKTKCLIGFVLAASVTAAHFQAFELFSVWVQHYEHVQADELIVTLFFFCLLFLVLFIRRESELHEQLLAVDAAHKLAISAAYEDELTGLPNRRAFIEHAAQIQRHGKDFSVMLLDLDGFKAVNDEWGHEAGDEVLRHVALQLSELVKQFANGFAARLGGDEFAIIIEHASSADTTRRFARAVVKLLAAPLPSQHSPTIGASLGIAAHVRGETLSNALRKADKAMYQAKQSGGSCYMYSSFVN